MNKEIWKDVKGYEGHYQVSDNGKVKSLDRQASNGRVMCDIKGKILQKHCDGRGYNHLALSKEGKVKRFKIYRLVAEAFIPNPNNHPVINHKDGNKRNDTVSNLEWVTVAENNQHAWDNGLNRNTKTQRKAASNWCYDNKDKMMSGRKVMKVKCITNGKIYNSINEASDDLGISYNMIYRVVSGKRNHTHGYEFKKIESD